MVFDQMVRRIRTSGSNPVTHGRQSWWGFNSSRSQTGIRVNTEKALGLTAAYRGVTLIASLAGALPIDIFEKGPDNTRVDAADDSNRTLWLKPNPEMERQTFMEACIGQEILGNCFIFVDKDSDPVNPDLWPLDSDRVKVGRMRNGQKVYEIDGDVPMINFSQGGEIIHVMNFSRTGFLGYNPFKLAEEALAIGVAAQEYAARFYGQADTPPGYLATEQTLTEDQSEKLGNRWNRLRAGLSRAHRAAVLSHGVKFVTTGFDPESSQLQEARKFNVNEIGRLLGIPPHLLGDVEKSTSWGAGIEEQNIGLLVYTVSAHITRFEQAFDNNYLVREISGRFCKFNQSALLRGSTLKRFQAYKLADFMTKNEKRRLEDLPPKDGGDVLMEQVNMAPLDALDQQAMQQDNGPQPSDN